MAMKTFFYSAEVCKVSDSTQLLKRSSGTISLSNETFGEDLGAAAKAAIASKINKDDWAPAILPKQIHLTAFNPVY